MNEGEKRHILANLSELVDKTAWRVSCKTVPIEKGVFGNEDVAELECIANERKRIYKFYEIFMKKKNSYQHLITTLEAGLQSGAVVILNKFDANLPVAGTSSKKVPIGVRFDVRQPVRLFTGRLKELAELHEKLQESKSKGTVVSHMASIVGLGGIGKTELARRYIQEYGEYYDNNVVWISAETEETLRLSFRRVAIDCLKTLLNVDGKEKHMKTVIEEVYNFFNGKQCLFVFDNAETNMGIQTFLPLQVVNSIYVLITSRDKNWSFDVEMLELHEMDELEAVAFVMKGLQIQNDGHPDIVAELVKTLQCFPLALSQAISYIKQKRKLGSYTITQYLSEYKSHSVKLLNYDAHLGPLNTYTKTTFTTWKLTTECVFANEECGNEAMRMLNMMSYFQPDKIPTKLLIEQMEKTSVQPATNQQSGISSQLLKFFISFLKIGAEVKIDSPISSFLEKNEKALQLLFKHSMINIQTTEETISIHRLVQEVTRIELRKQELEEATLKNALRLLSENIHLKTISHFCSVYKYCDAYKKLVVDFKYVPSRVMKLLDDIEYSTCYSEVGVGYEMKEMRRKHVSSEDEDVARLELWIGNANYRAGNVAIAAKVLEQILPTYIANKDGKFSKLEILNIQYFLAVYLMELGNQSESIKQLLQIYESAKTLLGVNHWWTTQVLVDIAECLKTLGHFTNPFSENTENIQVSTQEFILPGPQTIISLLKAAYKNHRHLIGTDFNQARNSYKIAIFFKDKGDNAMASIIATDAYEQGRGSTDTSVQRVSMMCLKVLGALKENEGKFEEALEISREAHALSLKYLGDNHPDTLLYKANMLEMLGYAGAGETALSGLRDVLETLVTSYPNHSYLFGIEISIGITLFNLKRHDESLVLFVDLRKRLVERLGHTYRLMSKVNYWIRKLQNVEPEIT